MTTPIPTPQYNPTPVNPMDGGLLTLVGTFILTSTGLPTDPTTITVKVNIGGVTTTYVYPNAFITKVSTGVYSVEIDTTANPGPGTCLFKGTGAVQCDNAFSWYTTPAPI